MEKCKYHNVCELYADADPEAGLCILHSQNPNKDKYLFNTALEKHRMENGGDFRLIFFSEKADFSEATFPGDVVFSGATFSGDVDFSEAKFSGKAYFFMAKLSGKANFSQATFSEMGQFPRAEFSGDADFSEATFSGHAAFFMAEFSEMAIFSRVTFSEMATFRMAEFSGDGDFSGAKFSEMADFGEAMFSGKATFVMAEFSGNADFSRATFSGSTYFPGATFSGDADFSQSEFSGRRTYFPRATFLGRAMFLGRAILIDAYAKDKASPILKDKVIPIFSEVKNEVDFRGVNVSPTQELIFRDADFSKCLFGQTDLRKAEFTGVSWPKPGKRFQVYDEICPLRPSETRRWDHIERLYRELKRNHEDRRDYERAGDFHYGEKQMRRKSPETPFLLKCLLTLYWTVSGYGERYIRPLVCAFVLLVASTCGYLILGIAPNKAVTPLALTNPKDWLHVGLYSLQVMTLLRPMDLVPLTVAATGVKVFQSLLGPIIIGLFALAIRQRLKR